MRDVRRNGGGRGLRGGGRKKSGWSVSWTTSELSTVNADQWTTAAQDEGETRIAAEKVRAGLRHALVVVCPNVMGRTKETIAQSKRARVGSLAFMHS